MPTASTLIALLTTAADGARVVMHVYSASLTMLIPLTVALVATVALRDARAGARAVVWRASVLAILVVFLGKLLPSQWVAWVVPAGLASPLVMLGRPQQSGAAESMAVQLLFLTYCVGVTAVLVPVVLAAVGLRRRATRAQEPREPRLSRLLDEARARLGVRCRVRVLVSDDAQVPVTWGVLRPIILMPRALAEWDDARLRAVLLHEIGHVRAYDAAFSVASRVMCALFWFHPGAWWVNRRLHADCEHACDDQVLASGVLASEYAELLALACDRLHAPTHRHVALAMSERVGLRGRLASIVDPSRDRRRPATVAGLLAVALTLGVTVPASFVQLAPTRGVLDTLMRDARWESRAYAVLGLAQRADSVDVARSAATTDPSPEVRAWARYALSRDGGPGLVPPLPLR